MLCRKYKNNSKTFRMLFAILLLCLLHLVVSGVEVYFEEINREINNATKRCLAHVESVYCCDIAGSNFERIFKKICLN